MRACAIGAMIAVALLAASAGASAQSYPERPVRVLIAFPALLGEITHAGRPQHFSILPLRRRGPLCRNPR